VQIDRETGDKQGKTFVKHVNFDLTNTYRQYNVEGNITQDNTGSLIETKTVLFVLQQHLFPV